MQASDFVSTIALVSSIQKYAIHIAWAPQKKKILVKKINVCRFYVSTISLVLRIHIVAIV